MGPGLPGFGIASLFYIAAALLAPLKELGLTLRGRGCRDRRRASFTQFFIGAGMLISLILFYVFLAVLIRRLGIDETRGPGFLARFPNWVFAAATLAMVLGIGSLVGRLLSARTGEESPDEVAAAHRDGVVELVLDLRTATRMCEQRDAAPVPPPVPPEMLPGSAVPQPQMSLASRSVRL